MADTKTDNPDIVLRELAPGVTVEWSLSLGGPLTSVKAASVAPEKTTSPVVDLSPFAILAERDARPNSGPDAFTHENSSAQAVAEAVAAKEKQDAINAKRAETLAAKKDATTTTETTTTN